MVASLVVLLCVLLAASAQDFEWYREPWGDCMRDRSSCCGRCSQRRDVYCAVAGTTDPVPSRYCDGVVPSRDSYATVQDCTQRCVQDCVVGQWSEWSVCSKTCGILGNEHRLRTVLEAPGAGLQCPVLSQARTCRNVSILPDCPEPVRPTGSPGPIFRWRLGAWGSCQAFASGNSGNATDCGPGVRSRIVNCVAENGSLVDELNCKRSPQEPSPASAQACNLPCDCIVSSWSAWSECSIECIANRTLLSSASGDGINGSQANSTSNEDPDDPHVLRTRTVLRASQFGGDGCPHLRERRECNLHDLPDCPQYEWVTGDYGACEINRTIAVCGIGVQTRLVYCQETVPHTSGNIVRQASDEKFCTGEVTLPGASAVSNPVKPLVSRTCQVQCPEDCQMGQWGAWTQCSQSCGEDGVRQRQRPILALPRHGGKECDATQQTSGCEIINCTYWFVSRFSLCLVDKGTCGVGKRHRSVFCLDSLGNTANDSECAYQGPKPSPVDVCYVPCPVDCVLSDWSSWSECPFPCGRAGSIVSRSRSIELPSTSGQCVDSDELGQRAPCNAFIPCISYVWRTQPWDSCQRHQGNESEVCGELVGEQFRDVFCEEQVAGFGQNRGDKCPAIAMPSSNRSCTINCPVDCGLSAWSEWSGCSATCGGATRTRSRFINQTAAFGGKECPANDNGIVTDEEVCSDNPPCYTHSWEAGDWSNCSVFFANDTCGPGFQTRSVVCRRSDGFLSPDGICSDTLFVAQPGRVQDCYIPCKDECIFTEWSPFGPCYPSCGPIAGNRNRSRNVLSDGSIVTDFETNCPHIQQSDVFQSDPCVQRDCVTYGWVSTHWLSCILPAPNECGNGVQTRYSLCERSNRVHVSAILCANTGVASPATTRSCNIPCPVDCEVSTWSEWSACCGSTLRSRNRTVVKPKSNGGRQCPFLGQSYLCFSHCGWSVGDWGNCRLPSNQTCGNGIRHRDVACLVDAKNGSDALCSVVAPKPIDESHCDLPCVSSECVMGPWSEWSDCQVVHPSIPRSSYCDPASIGSRERTRTRTRNRPGTGSDCDTKQTVDCVHPDCLTYEWTEKNWGDCVLDATSSLASCGSGIRERQVACESTSFPIITDESKCDSTKKPVEKENCSIPCSVDCKVSQWSPFSICNGVCGGHGTRTRTRRVTLTGQSGGRDCPSPLSQTEQCGFLPCFNYTFYRSEWSECTIGADKCGIGERTRSVRCLRHDGTDTFDFTCCLEGVCRQTDDNTGDRGVDFDVNHNIHRQEECGEPCPGACVLADWSAWSPCTTDCQTAGTGTQTRSRGIIVEPSDGALPCDSERIRSRVCFDDDCFTYQWVTGNWTDQDTRTVDCYRFSGDNKMVGIVAGGCDPLTRPPNTRTCVPICGENMMCTDDAKCVCMTDYEMDNSGICFPVSGCSSDSHCPRPYTECNATAGECDCEPGHLKTRGSTDKEDCTVHLCSTTCEELKVCDTSVGQCKCGSPYVEFPGQGDCYPPGGCLRDGHCTVGNAICNRATERCECAEECGENQECSDEFECACESGFSPIRTGPLVCARVEPPSGEALADSEDTPFWAWIILAVGLVILLVIVLLVIICCRRHGYKSHTFTRPVFEQMDHIGPAAQPWIQDPHPRPRPLSTGSNDYVNKRPLEEESDFGIRPASPSDDSDLDIKKHVYDTEIETDTDFDGYQSTLEKRRL